jgi:hypothetical protein
MKVIARSSNLLGKITILVMVSFVVNTALALDGSGTQEDPWRIKSLEDFNDFAADANYWDDYTRLETDVNLAGRIYPTAVIAPDVNNANYWDFDGTAFTGVFDGNDRKIIGLTIDDDGAGNDYLGLFGCIDEGEVRNLGLEDCSVSGDVIVTAFVGGLAGRNYGNSSISNCFSTGYVSGVYEVGGLVGENGDLLYGMGNLISNCYSTGDVNGVAGLGGLVGVNYGKVLNCKSTGDVNGVEYVGGLVGYNAEGGNILNCSSTGDVRGGDFSVGGLVGENSYFSVISKCYSSGDVNGVEDVGGLIGKNYYDTIVSNCYSSGDVNGVSTVGGLAGWNESGIVSNCYSTGNVSGDERVGGLMGLHFFGSISNCFWDTDAQTHGVTRSIGDVFGTITNVHGLPTYQLHQQSTFTGWDFINVWGIGENQTYPYLRKVLPSDLNKDRITNFLDIAILCEGWLIEE